MPLRHVFAIAAAACLTLATANHASAHVSIGNTGVAGQNTVITFSVGHGCAGADTFRIVVHIPPEITTLRALPSVWGDATITLDGTSGAPTAVSWEKATVKDGDDQYYQFQIRMRIPDAPFTTLYVPVTQVCRDMGGTETTVEWEALPTDTKGEPAAELVILPARAAGWHKFTTTAAIADLGTYFADAQIVWAGDSAFSSNASVMELIEAEDDVSVLSSIASGTQIWVKY